MVNNRPKKTSQLTKEDWNALKDFFELLIEADKKEQHKNKIKENKK